MKKQNYTSLWLAGWLLLGTGLLAQVQGQSNRFLPYSTVSFGGGTSTYIGDLAGYGNLPKTLVTLPRWNVGFSFTRQFTPRLAARASFTYARISGDDYTYSGEGKSSFQYVTFVRNLHFRNDLKEFALTGQYNLIAEGRTADRRPRISPYIFGGFAAVAHSPEARSPVDEKDPANSRQWVKLQPLGTEGQGQPGYAKAYSLIALAIPVGAGIKWRINDDFNVGIEVGYRYTFTDYLDDVGSNYAAPGVLTGLAAQMSDRRLEPFAARVNLDRVQTATAIANTPGGVDYFRAYRTGQARLGFLSNDAYILTTFQIQYIIPGKIKCPVIK